MGTKGLGVNAALALAVAVTVCRADDGPDAEIAQLRAQVKELQAANQALRAEVLRLRDELAEAPRGVADQARLDADLDRLSALCGALDKRPDDGATREEAAALAKRLAPDLPGNPLVWQALLKTQTLKDGLPLAEAEKLLGPPTEKSGEHVGWYFNSGHRLHVAPCLNAKATPEGLVEWQLDRR